MLPLPFRKAPHPMEKRKRFLCQSSNIMRKVRHPDGVFRHRVSGNSWPMAAEKRLRFEAGWCPEVPFESLNQAPALRRAHAPDHSSPVQEWDAHALAVQTASPGEFFSELPGWPSQQGVNSGSHQELEMNGSAGGLDFTWAFLESRRIRESSPSAMA
jgi:hypothetical protein